MDRETLSKIQETIGYKFQNTDLLQQAFVRRSYSKENGGENNEVLEFIGDKVLDLVVVKILSERFGSFADEWDDYNPQTDWNEYICEYQEDKLSEIRKRLVEKKTLARRIEDLGLEEHLIMGQGDIRNNVQKSVSVKEDLFEAILGAIAKDCNFKMDKLQDAVELMLNPDAIIFDDEINYIQEIQDWALKETGSIPSREFKAFQGVLWGGRNMLRSPVPAGTKYFCHLKIEGLSVWATGYGVSKTDAHEAAAKEIYNYLEQHDMLHTIRDEIEEPSLVMAINQLEILARRGYFSLPTYEEEEKFDADGKAIWRVECYIEEWEYSFWAEGPSKKQAKKEAAYDMLLDILENY